MTQELTSQEQEQLWKQERDLLIEELEGMDWKNPEAVAQMFMGMAEEQSRDLQRNRKELKREAEEAASVDWSDPEQSGEYLFQTALMQKQRLQENRERMETELTQDNLPTKQSGMEKDSELMLAGMRLAAFHIEAGSNHFTEYAEAMIEDLGDAVRPYLKLFYNGVRDWPVAADAGLTHEMDSYAEVERLHAAYQQQSEQEILSHRYQVYKTEQASNQTGHTSEERIKPQPEKYLGEKEQEYLADLIQKDETGQEMSVEESADLMFLLTKSRPEPGEGLIQMAEQMQPLSPEEREQLRQLTDKEERGETLTWQEGGLQLALLVRAEAFDEQE